MALFGSSNVSFTPAPNGQKKGFLNAIGLGGLFGSSNTQTAPPAVGGKRKTRRSKKSKGRKGRKGTKRS